MAPILELLLYAAPTLTVSLLVLISTKLIASFNVNLLYIV